MKKLIILLLSCVLLSGCSNPFNDAASKEDIFAFVNEHYEELLDAMKTDIAEIENENYEAVAANINYYIELPNSPVKSRAFPENRRYEVVDFPCGSVGITLTAYSVGFYYSQNNTPFAFYSSSEDFEETSPGIFEYHTTKKYEKAARIRENWFWYERSWS